MIAFMILNMIVSKEKEFVTKIIIQIDDITIAVLTTITTVIDDHDQITILKLAGFHHRQDIETTGDHDGEMIIWHNLDLK